MNHILKFIWLSYIKPLTVTQSLTIGFTEIRLTLSSKHSISQISFRRCLYLEIKPNPFSDVKKSSHDQI